MPDSLSRRIMKDCWWMAEYYGFVTDKIILNNCVEKWRFLLRSTLRVRFNSDRNSVFTFGNG